MNEPEDDGSNVREDMAQEKNPVSEISGLSSCAEEMVKSKLSVREDLAALSFEEIQRLAHELRIQNDELEMQNEDLRKAQLELEDLKEAYQDLYDSAPNGCLTLSDKGLILETNYTAGQILGWDKRSLTNTFFSRFVPQKYKVAYGLHLRHLFETRTKQTCQIKLVRKNGTHLFAQLDSVAKKDDAGRFNRCRTVVTDISDLKRDEEDLRSSEREQSIRNAIAQILLTTDDDDMYGEVLQVILNAMKSEYGVFAYVNEDGATVTPSMTKDVWEKCRVPGKTRVFPRETLANGIWTRAMIEKRTLWKNEPGQVPQGHVPIENVIVVPIMYRAEAVGHFTVANKKGGYGETEKDFLEGMAEFIAPVLNARLERDRSDIERRRAADALRLSEEKFSQAFMLSPDPIVMTRFADGTIVSVNEACMDLIGYREDELIGTSVLELGLWRHDEDRKKVTKALKTQGRVYAYETRFRPRMEVFDMDLCRPHSSTWTE